MTARLSYEAVWHINHTITGNGVVRDSGALEAALNRPFSGFGGIELFPTLIEKAAVLLHGVATSHAFLDGNKRTALIACLSMLSLNGRDIRDDGTGGPMVLAIVEQHQDHRPAALWLTGHLL